MLRVKFEEAGLEAHKAKALTDFIYQAQNTKMSPPNLWRSLCATRLQPTQPFGVHQVAFEATYADWDRKKQGPPPTWIPTSTEIAGTNLAQLLNGGTFDALHQRSVNEPEWYWSEVFERLGIQTSIPPERILDRTNGAENARWFPGMHLNIAMSCFQGRDPNRAALIWAGSDGVTHEMTIGELEAASHRLAWALRAEGFESGDAIAIDMPMTHQSVVIYLGCILAGCVVVSIADSFAPNEIATRLAIAKAKGIFTQDVILRGGKRLPLYERVIEAQAPKAIVLPAGETLSLDLREGDVSWTAFLKGARTESFPAVISGAEDLTNILFSSGTTGTPKAIGWNHLTPIKAAADAWAHHDVQSGHVVAWPTNLGWMMGPWLIYAALLNDSAIALYEGIPSGKGFCRFVQDAHVTMLGVVPSLVRAWKSTHATDGLDWSAIRCFSSTGEASNPDEMHWLMSRAGYKPVIEYCGGTEIGGGYLCGSRVQPQVAAAFSTPAMGTDFLLLEENGTPCENGELALVPPMLGSSQHLLNRDHHQVYYEGMPKSPTGQVLRRHGDQVQALPGGFYRAMGRTDDTMNLGGIKVSSAELERACTLDSLKECAAIAVSPPGGGPSQLVVFGVLKGNAQANESDLCALMQRQIRQQLNPLFKVHAVRLIESLPRTASNKVMRRVLRGRFQVE
jgi:acetyl-CoA synthetase